MSKGLTNYLILMAFIFLTQAGFDFAHSNGYEYEYSREIFIWAGFMDIALGLTAIMLIIKNLKKD